MQGRLGVLSGWMVGLKGAHGLGMLHGVCLSAFGGMLAAMWALWRRQRAQAAAGRRERAIWEELEAYSRLDAALGTGGDAKPLARRVCRAVVEKSCFRRVAMLVRDAEGKLYVAGSSGMDDVTVESLRVWGIGVIRQERGLGPDGPVKVSARQRVGAGSFSMELAAEDAFDGFGFGADGPTPGRECREVVVTMLRGTTGSILGALVMGPEAGEKAVGGGAGSAGGAGGEAGEDDRECFAGGAPAAQREACGAGAAGGGRGA